MVVAKVHTNVNLRDSDRDIVYRALEHYIRHEEGLIKEYTPPADYKTEGGVPMVEVFIGTKADAVDTLRWMQKAQQKLVGQTIYRFNDDRLESVMNAMAIHLLDQNEVNLEYRAEEDLRARLVRMRGVDLSDG